MKRWLSGVCLCVAALAHGETWQFALIGDVPYSARERRELPRMLEAIADTHVAFIAHIGDIKHGQARCDDAVFADRQQLFNASRVPFVFVPGDNEWTDCSRLSNGSYDPLERLATLRSLFWQRPESLGRKTLPLERQAGAYPEHSRFRLGPVLFVTLNLPGPDNNHGWQDNAGDEFLARIPIRSFTLPTTNPINPVRYKKSYLYNPDGSRPATSPIIAWDEPNQRNLQTGLDGGLDLDNRSSKEWQNLYGAINRVVLIIPIPCLGDEYEKRKTVLDRPGDRR